MASSGTGSCRRSGRLWFRVGRIALLQKPSLFLTLPALILVFLVRLLDLGGQRFELWEKLVNFLCCAQKAPSLRIRVFGEVRQNLLLLAAPRKVLHEGRIVEPLELKIFTLRLVLGVALFRLDGIVPL